MFTLHPFNAAAYNVTNTAHNENKLVQCLQVMIAIQFALYSYNKQNTCNVKLKKSEVYPFFAYIYQSFFIHYIFYFCSKRYRLRLRTLWIIFTHIVFSSATRSKWSRSIYTREYGKPQQSSYCDTPSSRYSPTGSIIPPGYSHWWRPSTSRRIYLWNCIISGACCFGCC